MNEFTWPWEWDWNWWLVGIFAAGLFVLGLILYLISFPGISAVVIGGVLGGFASAYDWFEL
jgi:phage shock protein PspC (stress-responsive transcriptional regulator)